MGKCCTSRVPLAMYAVWHIEGVCLSCFHPVLYTGHVPASLKKGNEVRVHFVVTRTNLASPTCTYIHTHTHTRRVSRLRREDRTGLRAEYCRSWFLWFYYERGRGYWSIFQVGCRVSVNREPSAGRTHNPPMRIITYCDVGIFSLEGCWLLSTWVRKFNK